MRLLGQFQTLYFFHEKILHAPKASKASKAPKAQRRNQAKAQNATNEQKLKMHKHLRGKKSLIDLFAFLRFLCARKENRKKRKVSTM